MVPQPVPQPQAGPRLYACGKRKLECEHPGCIKTPVFNDPGASRGRFCKAHKCAPAPGPAAPEGVHKPVAAPGCARARGCAPCQARCVAGAVGVWPPTGAARAQGGAHGGREEQALRGGGVLPLPSLQLAGRDAEQVLRRTPQGGDGGRPQQALPARGLQETAQPELPRCPRLCVPLCQGATPTAAGPRLSAHHHMLPACSSGAARHGPLVPTCCQLCTGSLSGAPGYWPRS